MIETKNAVIKSVRLTTADYGCLSAWLELDYGNSGQGFGGYVLYLPHGAKHHRLEGTAGHFIYRCIEIGGVEKWEQLPGRTIRVRSEHDKVHAIGHIVKDDWFNPNADFSALSKS